MKELNVAEIAQVNGAAGPDELSFYTDIAGDILNAVGTGLDLGASAIGGLVDGYQGVSGPILHGIGDGVKEFGHANIASGVGDILAGVSKGVEAGVSDIKLVAGKFFG
ncbi:hypothetical protein [Carnimonas bestiolae]|uniref:hypothetical protein n=1 Tax=Carnimonas bestiolae TaxID=3402172 RepID=UPI003EDC1119